MCIKIYSIYTFSVHMQYGLFVLKEPYTYIQEQSKVIIIIIVIIKIITIVIIINN